MRALHFVVVAAVLVASGADAQGAGATRVDQSAAIDAMVSEAGDGLVFAQIATGRPDHIMMVARRTADGDVEVHTKMADELIIRTGHARIRVGGMAVGQRQTAPDEFRGGTIVGGETYDLRPGDMIYIPVGEPHQMLVAEGEEVTYLAVKFHD